jgi:hypothetical protein
LADKFAGAIGGGADGFQRLGFLVRRRFTLQEKAGIAQNDGQNVVEIVGDAGGQLPQGLHFLSLLRGIASHDEPRDFFLELVVGGLKFGGPQSHRIVEVIIHYLTGGQCAGRGTFEAS